MKYSQKAIQAKAIFALKQKYKSSKKYGALVNIIAATISSNSSSVENSIEALANG